MKCLKREAEVIRVSEEKVDFYLNKGYEYTNKQEWKKYTRGSNESPELKEAISTQSKKSKKRAKIYNK